MNSVNFTHFTSVASGKLFDLCLSDLLVSHTSEQRISPSWSQFLSMVSTQISLLDGIEEGSKWMRQLFLKVEVHSSTYRDKSCINMGFCPEKCYNFG